MNIYLNTACQDQGVACGVLRRAVAENGGEP
jgi:3-methyladenine DNA glycosylase Mpg